ncbi:MAG: tetratricopeptide repeat protein [Candidatus Dormibacteraeota bacterium]|uniref:Tetratricopeptide repeat protein n=1 Tax=Candidatus Nephthysia bennettiae TaxID=3127016 RepID=A0A934KG44_9BACT|nr:tetratricopeptide repeat protein [Candidatus Dormibacteraeota bacterium]
MQLDPGAADAHIGLGLLHRPPSRPVSLEEAIAAFRQAARIDPQRADSHLNLGAALIEAGERDLAAEELRSAQQLLVRKGELRQARGIDEVLRRLSADQPIKSIAFSYQSSRYRVSDAPTSGSEQGRSEPSRPPLLSPDRQWRWDGEQWVPNR